MTGWDGFNPFAALLATLGGFGGRPGFGGQQIGANPSGNYLGDFLRGAQSSGGQGVVADMGQAAGVQGNPFAQVFGAMGGGQMTSGNPIANFIAQMFQGGNFLGGQQWQPGRMMPQGQTGYFRDQQQGMQQPPAPQNPYVKPQYGISQGAWNQWDQSQQPFRPSGMVQSAPGAIQPASATPPTTRDLLANFQRQNY